MLNINSSSRLAEFLIKKCHIEVYSLAITHDIKIQGTYSSRSCKELCLLFPNRETCEQTGYIYFKSKKITIILTS